MNASKASLLNRLVVTVSSVAVGMLLALPIGSSAAPIVFSASGADAAAIQASVDAFRTAIGGASNGNALGSQPTGRREIGWDGGGAAANATIFPSPMNTFNSAPTTRGLVSTTTGTGLEISGQPSPEFGEINPTYPGIFQTFSSPRLFAPLGSNVIDVLFFVPGTNTPAAVTAFGAVFTDVDLANISSLELFRPTGVSLGVTSVSAFDNGLSFLGVVSPALIGSVRITTGNTALGPDDGGAIDVVALDDFIYAEPRVPEPASVLLFGAGLAALALNLRRRSRAQR
jgi:hypothetical protein